MYQSQEKGAELEGEVDQVSTAVEANTVKE